MISNETALLERLRRGDRQALATVYDEYAPMIYRYVYRRVSDARLAEDLTGQVFLKLIEALRRDVGWDHSFSGWLYRIAHNLIIDHYRRRGGQALIQLEEELESEAIHPERHAERTLRLLRVRQAIHALTEDQAQVIVLRFGEGLSNQEVATIMGKSEGAIKGLQHRALRTLRHLLVFEEEV